METLPGGQDIYVYGEGWDFGSLKDKGFDDRHATQLNMAGTGIGTFNDRIRDAAHGGFNDKPEQGFINGQFYDPNGIGGSNQGTLRYSQDRLRIGLAGNLQTFSFTDQADNSVTGASLNGTGYTLDPQEAVNYVTKHDNETLFDLNAYKLPRGDDGTNVTSMADRVRAHNMGLSVIGLGQGIPFLHAGSDMLRSKSMDRNSYDSGDWFNRLDFTYNDNNFPAGLPPAWDNSGQYSTITPLLQDSDLYAGNSDIVDSVDHFQEMLQIRYSSPLFRLTTADDINSRVQFHNTGSSQLDGLIVMSLSDQPEPDLDGNNESIWVLFNANDEQQTFTVNELLNDVSVALHPVQQGSADPVVQTASFDSATGTFTIPARTTAVFESQAIIDSPSSLDYVGRMFPRGGQSNAYNVGESATHEVYVQVYEQGITDSTGQGAGISCYVSYGPVGGTQTDVAMSYNTDIGINDNNDEYVGTLDISALAAGTYSVDTYCQLDGETKKKWRQDDLGISPVDEGFSIISVLPGSTPPPDDTFVHLFEWKWSDIENECPYLADVGYDAVQVSPPQEHAVLDTADTDPWWTRYQPVSYTLQGRSGSPAEFQSMVNACNAVGVDIYVDAVINHTTGQNVESTGSAGTVYNHYDHPGLYDGDDYHYCGTNSGASDDSVDDITNYNRRYEVQECELVDLADLETDNANVQTTIGAYLQSLVDMGVAGFRIDASKHMFTHDITQIMGTVTGDFYVFQEVIGAAGEPVKPYEYVINGDVTEFGYSNAIGNAFNCGGNLAGLENIGNGLLRSDDAVVFVDNHDNQRGHGAGGACVLDHTDGDDKYNLGNVFMLAYPYGYPKVMSSYVWDYTPNLPNIENADSNPPPTAPVYDGNGNVTGCNDTDWVCEHRRQPIAGMVGFRAATSGQPLTDWSTISTNQVAFGRGNQGFVVLNNTGSALTGQTFNTSLNAGTYCDVITGGLSNDGLSCVGTAINVNTNGEIIGTDVPATSAIAIHASARLSINNTDVNGDLLVTPQDAVYVINRIGDNDPSADVNGDTFVNDTDVQAVIADIGTDNRPD